MGQDADSAAGSASGADKGEYRRLIDRVREAILSRHYSRRTEKTYWYWIRFFIHFHGKRHPAEMGGTEVQAFLSWLATERDVAAATQNQALSALLFLYQKVLGQELPWLDGIARAKRPVRLPFLKSPLSRMRAAFLTRLNSSMDLQISTARRSIITKYDS